jgi:hypothetical protein
MKSRLLIVAPKGQTGMASEELTTSRPGGV